MILHKNNAGYHHLLVTLFFFLALGLGFILSYFLMQRSVEKDIRGQLDRAIASLDITLAHAEQAAEQAARFLDKPCDDATLTGIRTIAATVPNVRSVNLVRQNQTYCTSVFGSRAFNVNSSEYRNGSLTLLRGNSVSPSRAFVFYSLQRTTGGTVLIGIDGYYLYSVLRVLEGPSRLFMRVGGRYLNHEGQVVAYVDTFSPVQVASHKFGYSLIASHPDVPIWKMFLRHEWHPVILVPTLSLLLSLIFRNVLIYRGTLEFMLRRAIKRKQLTPYIQPVVEGEEGRVVGGEVLIRWDHPRLGFISPEKFIAVAEQSGMIKNITALCFSHVLSQMCTQGPSLPEGLFISFNISDADFQDNDIIGLCKSFRQKLKHLRLVLEITERRAVENTQRTAEVAIQLRLSGVDFSLDDFGTGHANYSYLGQFRPHYIKVDKMFTSAVSTDTASSAVVSSMVALAEKFNCTIIAEGVEDYAQLQALQRLGVRLFQGYYFARPMSVKEFISNVLPKN